MNTLNNSSQPFAGALITLVTPAGLAAVVASTAAFGMLIGIMSGMQINPVWFTVLFVCVAVTLTSSPPAALGLALPVIAKLFIWNAAPAVDPGAVARVAALASTTFETLPFNGMILLSISIARSTHKQSYLPMFLQTVVYTFIGTIVAAALLVAFPGLV